MGVFEIRLASGNTPVDFSVRLDSSEQARGLAAKFSPPHLQELLETGWCGLGHPSPVSSLWLEFDLASIDDRDSEDLPTPIVCARLTRPPDSDWLIDRLLPALHGRPLTAIQIEVLTSCLERLPEDWRVLYAFSLLSRPDNPVRLELLGHRVDTMLGYVREAISEDAANRLEASSRLYGGCDRYHLSFDVGEQGISSRIGVEYAYARLPDHEPRWAELFDRLVEAGLCTLEKRDAVLDWPGQDTIWTAASRWPEGAGGYCVRGLSHLKVVDSGDACVDSKVYLIHSLVAAAAAGSSRPVR